MTLDEINYIENFSVRSYNICLDNGLTDLSTILNYYNKNKTFKNLKNCGTRSDRELTSLCLKYIALENLGQEWKENKFDLQLSLEKVDDWHEKENKIYSSKISKLNRIQREVINSFIEINSNNLTNRSKNAISSYLNSNFNIRYFSERIIINESFNIQDIKNVGAKSTIELITYINLIKEFVNKVSEVKVENQLISLRNRYFIEKSFSISEIPTQILESLSIFKWTEFLMNNNAVFDKKKYLIFQRTFNIYRNQPKLTLADIAIELNLTKERVRQIRKSIMDDLFSNFHFIRNIEDDLFQKYQIDINQKFIFIDDDISDLINRNNHTNFSKEFIAYLIYVSISNKFSIIGNLEDVLFPKHFNSKERHNWEYFYLVNIEIDNVFQFNDFVDDINKRLDERIEENYKFNFKSYLSNFLTDASFDLLEQVTEITELIINKEFGIYLDLEDNIPFSRNSVKQAYEYAYEALKQIGKPSKVNEVTSKILELHPDYETDDAKVRASMKRQNGFVPIGRKSVFGLKAWESELENFKGGTIRSIVLEYLENHLEPQHISTITSYVLKFRPKSNEYSILQNLKLDESGSFLFFKNSNVGLSSKNYDKSYILVSNENAVEKKSWEERYSDLKQFLNQNSRLPFSSGCPENETKLYRWYKIQLGKSRKGDLDSEKSTLIKDVFDKYEQNKTRRRRTNVTDKYNELITFVMEQKRLPSANKEGEENLYQFFYKQRKFYDKEELKPDEEQNFIKVAKIIQTQIYEN